MPNSLAVFIVIIVAIVISGDVFGITPVRLVRKLLNGTPLTYDGDGFAGKVKLLLLDIIACSIVAGGLMLIFQ